MTDTSKSRTKKDITSIFLYEAGNRLAF